MLLLLKNRSSLTDQFITAGLTSLTSIICIKSKQKVWITFYNTNVNIVDDKIKSTIFQCITFIVNC